MHPRIYSDMLLVTYVVIVSMEFVGSAVYFDEFYYIIIFSTYRSFVFFFLISYLHGNAAFIRANKWHYNGEVCYYAPISWSKLQRFCHNRVLKEFLFRGGIIACKEIFTHPWKVSYNGYILLILQLHICSSKDRKLSICPCH